MVAAFGGKNGRREPGAWTVGPKSAGQSKLHRAQFGVAHNVRNRSQNHKGGVTTDYDGNCPAERSHSNPSFYHNRPDRPDLASEGILLTKTKQELPADCLNPVGSTLEGHPRVVLPPVRKFVILRFHSSALRLSLSRPGTRSLLRGSLQITAAPLPGARPRLARERLVRCGRVAFAFQRPAHRLGPGGRRLAVGGFGLLFGAGPRRNSHPGPARFR